MVYHRQFALLDEFPHVPPDIVDCRLKKRSHVDDEGCRLWTGSQKGGQGMVRLAAPGGRYNALFAHKLAWYVAYGTYPRRPTMLISICRRLNCIEPSHYRAEGLRKLTDAQVVEARELFWTPWLKFNERQRSMVAPSAEQLAAWDLGMDVKTIRRVVQGGCFDVAKWQGYAKTPDEVLAAVARRQQDAADRKADHETIWSQESLAVRYGLSLASMHYVLHGITYQSVPMPAAADRATQTAAQMGKLKPSIVENNPPARRGLSAQRQQLAAEAALVVLPSDLLPVAHHPARKHVGTVEV